MKVVNGVLAVLFIVFAAFQYNDPDPWLWITIYLVIAIFAGLAAFGKYPSWLLRGGLLSCFIGLGILLPDFMDWLSNGAESITQSMKTEKPHIELTREFLGLVICALTLGFFLWQGDQAKKPSR